MTDPIEISSYEQKRLRMIASHARGPQILDVGYARKPNRQLLALGAQVTGVDLVRAHLDTGYHRHIVGDVFALLELDDGRAYDSIVAGEFLEHVEEPYRLLRLLAGVATPAGRLILSTPNPVGFPVVALEWLRSTRRFYTSGHTYYFAPRWVARILNRTGWELQIAKAVGLWPLGLPCPVGLSYQVVYVATRVQ